MAETDAVSVKTRTIPSYLDELMPGLLATAELFEHVADTAFFVKDRAGRYVVVNRSLADRCGVPQADLLNRHVREVFPRELADRYASQDDAVMRSGRGIFDRLEMHWYTHRRAGWCLTTKVPVRNAAGAVCGLIGLSRDLKSPGGPGQIPPGLSVALEWLEKSYAEKITPADLAKAAGLSATRLARLIKRIFRLTPIQLIAQTRLAAASRLLAETKLSVADVAVACGFYDHSAFTRAFHSATGVAPRQFRSQATSTDEKGSNRSG